MYYDDHLPSVKIPVRLVNGCWEFFYGGPVPVEDGTVGDLVVSAPKISDPKFLEKLSKKYTVKILDQGAKLFVALTVSDTDSLPTELLGHLVAPPNWRATFCDTGRLSEKTQFVEVAIGAPNEKKKGNNQSAVHQPLLPGIDLGGLWLNVKGLAADKIVSSSITLPSGISAQPAKSLNHAFTILSETYETERMTHTGNVYQRVFYQEADGRWCPLDWLRQAELAVAENALIHAAWAEIAKAIGLDLPTQPPRQGQLA